MLPVKGHSFGCPVYGGAVYRNMISKIVRPHAISFHNLGFKAVHRLSALAPLSKLRATVFIKQ